MTDQDTNNSEFIRAEFTACKHLDYETNYVGCVRNGISGGRGTVLCWNRTQIDADLPRLVQFCKLRGRLNDPLACIQSERKVCNEYEDFNHVHRIPLKELES